jgi:hypothetical protein
MHIERKESRLIVQSRNTQQLGGAFSVAFGIAILLLLSRLTDPPAEGILILLLVAAAFIIFGLFFLLPRRITTIFDSASRQVHQTIIIGNWSRHTRNIAFAEIASLGFDRHDDTFYAVIRLQTGETVSIDPNPYNEMNLKLFEAIAAETGLPNRNSARQRPMTQLKCWVNSSWSTRTFWDLRPFARELQQEFLK